jgi:hypothetical protein
MHSPWNPSSVKLALALLAKEFEVKHTCMTTYIIQQNTQIPTKPCVAPKQNKMSHIQI